MLDLYTHEIPCPDDRAIRKFLWYSAFHDGTILSVGPSERHGGDLILRVEHGVLQGIARTGTYLLRFHGVTHIECGGNPFCNSASVYDTLFLDSALLHAEERECQRRLYHLRISTWSGFIDVVFARFSIRQEGGRVSYRLPDIDEGMIAANRDHRYRACIAELADRLASPRPYDDMDAARYTALGLREDDLDEYHAFSLYITAQDKAAEEVAAHARQVLALGLTRAGAPSYAAYLLGKYGNAKDLPRLTELYLTLRPWRVHSRRIVLDAMERIHEREAVAL